MSRGNHRGWSREHAIYRKRGHWGVLREVFVSVFLKILDLQDYKNDEHYAEEELLKLKHREVINKVSEREEVGLMRSRAGGILRPFAVHKIFMILWEERDDGVGDCQECRLVAGSWVDFQQTDSIFFPGWKLRSSTAREGKSSKLEIAGVEKI